MRIQKKFNKENNLPSSTIWTKVEVISGFYQGLTGLIEGKINKKDKHKIVFDNWKQQANAKTIFEAYIPKELLKKIV